MAIVGTYYRIVGWLKALCELDSLPHYQAVASGARSLFELLLDMKLIQTDSTGDLVKKFHAFPEVERYRAALNLVSYCDKTNKTGIDCTPQRKFVNGTAKESSINAIILQHWGKTKKGKPNWPSHWSGKNVPDRAEILGPEYEELYFEFYPLLSWHIHSGSTGYARFSEKTFESMFGLMHGTIQKVVLDATEICAEEMKIDKIDNLEKPFKEMIEDLRKSTDTILVQKYSEIQARQKMPNKSEL
jgi:hypothetical protein